MKPASLYARACKIVGLAPNVVRLVGPAQYKAITGKGVGSALGYASMKEPRVIYVRRTQGLDSYIHELLHHLFPHKPHWWIYLAAYKLAGVPARAKLYGYGGGQQLNPDRKIESKATLTIMTHKAAAKMHAANTASPDSGQPGL